MQQVLRSADFHILLSLSEGPRHGYGIMKDVELESGGGVGLEIGSLYRLLSRLLEEGLIEDADSSSDERRRYYRITRTGKRALKA
ncbi:MAG TPA: helix-turn-helix transcriptional regulator, partial [Bryobacteraceae bacterium]